jgi:hypothetical protein
MLLYRMLLSILLELSISDMLSADERGDQYEPPIGFFALLRCCRGVRDRRHWVSRAVHALRVSLWSETPYTVDLIAAYQALGYPKFILPVKFLGPK